MKDTHPVPSNPIKIQIAAPERSNSRLRLGKQESRKEFVPSCTDDNGRDPAHVPRRTPTSPLRRHLEERPRGTHPTIPTPRRPPERRRRRRAAPLYCRSVRRRLRILSAPLGCDCPVGTRHNGTSRDGVIRVHGGGGGPFGRRRRRQLRRGEVVLSGTGFVVCRAEGAAQRHHRGPERQAVLLRPCMPQVGRLL
jgi:hypothetical protein